MTDQPIPMTPRPDAELGCALERFDPPELGAGFWETLADHLAAEPDVAKPPERRRRPWLRLAAVAAAAAIAAVLVLWFGLPGLDKVGVPGSGQGPVVVGPEPATAAEVVAQLEQALMTVRNVQATLIERSLAVEPGAEEGGNVNGVEVPPGAYIDRLYATVVRSDGSFRRQTVGVLRWSLGEDDRVGGDLPEGSGQTIETYDATAGVSRYYQEEYSHEDESGKTWSAESAMEDRGLAAGPPDWYIGVEFGHGAVARAAGSLATGTVKGVVYDGRPAWVVTAAIPHEKGRGSVGLNQTCDRPISRIAVTVDEATGYPVRIQEYAHGVVHYEVRLEGVKIDEPIPVDTFTIEREEGWPESNDLGYRDCALEDLAGLVGYDPRLPAWLPSGFAMTRITYAPVTAEDTYNPSINGSDVANVRYERGFESITVTARHATKPHLSAVTDPFAYVGNYSPEDAPPPDERRIEAGAYAGATARVVTSQVVVPHLWLVSGDVMVTVAGDLTERELLRIVESM
jgi:hypothetical protein